ncbi:MAG: protein-glutamate methylesterase/protein-glutamine glutaminase [Pirellulaceae bacterium]
MSADPVKVLIVDDSALYRQSIQNVLRDVETVKIVGSAKNGIEALDKIEQLDPDLLTLDVQMPDMDGIELLTEIKRRNLKPGAIMVSSHTSEGAQVTTDALMQGAFDFILKPSSGDPHANRDTLQHALTEKIIAFRDSRACREPRLVPESAPSVFDSTVAWQPSTIPRSVCRAIVIGTSTGGPEALRIVLPRLTDELQVPVFVVQHMPSQYTKTLARRLNQYCALEVTEASDNSEVGPGQIVIAPGGRQMKLESDGSRLLTKITDDPHEHGVRPAVDYLLRSASNVVNGDMLAVIMTGMGRDGRAGCRQLKDSGGFVFAQSPEDSVVFGMPKAVIEAGLADRVLTLGKIAPAILRHVKRSRRAQKGIS